jgi:ABC-type transporter Mla maintaining outer membrane lipid asymmetry ATPase subunit MlaF
MLGERHEFGMRLGTIDRHTFPQTSPRVSLARISAFSRDSPLISSGRETFSTAAASYSLLVGPLGCGKTTLISIIAATLEQDSGNCELLGRDLKNMEQKERTRLSRSVDRPRVSIFQPAAGVQR